MNNPFTGDKVRSFLFENKVPLFFAVVTIFTFWASDMGFSMLLNEMSIRFGRETFLVLSLLIPIIAGLGLNFGIVLGAMAAQIAMFFVILWDGSGGGGVLAIFALATPIAIVLGYLVGRLFNMMKGSEMIGGMITALFAEGFYQILFLFVFGGVFTIANARIMTSTGVGVLNVIDIGSTPNYMRQVIDNTSILQILDVALVVLALLVLGIIIYRKIKKIPIDLKQKGFRGLVIATTAVFIVHFASGFGGIIFVNDLTFLIYRDRFNALYAVWMVALVLALMQIYSIVKLKMIEKREGVPIHPLVKLGLSILLFLATFIYDIYDGLQGLGLPVFTYLIIVGWCVAIKWLMSTKLGQNMRTVGQSRPVATAAGINVDRTRIIAMILSTILAAYGQIIMVQNLGVLTVYGQHTRVGLYAIAALLVGGATVAKASIKHAIIGIILFHSFFILAPLASTNLMGSPVLGEYARMFVANAVIALALVMHAWRRVKKRKAEKADKVENATT